MSSIQSTRLDIHNNLPISESTTPPKTPLIDTALSTIEKLTTTSNTQMQGEKISNLAPSEKTDTITKAACGSISSTGESQVSEDTPASGDSNTYKKKPIIIDENQFLPSLVKNNDQWTLQPTQEFDKSKLVSIRDCNLKAETICFSGDHVKKCSLKTIQEALDYMELSPCDPSFATTTIDLSIFMPTYLTSFMPTCFTRCLLKKLITAFPDIIIEGAHAFLKRKKIRVFPQYPVFQPTDPHEIEAAKAIRALGGIYLPKELSEKHIIQELPRDLFYKCVMPYMTFGYDDSRTDAKEIFSHPEFYRFRRNFPPEFAALNTYANDLLFWMFRWVEYIGKEDAPIEFPEKLAWMREQVTELRFSGEMILTPQMLEQLALYFPNVSSLIFHDKNGVDQLIEKANKFKKLTSLEIHGCDVTDAGLAHLKPDLKTLCLSHGRDPKISDQSIKTLSLQCPKLEKLKIYYSQVKGPGFDWLPTSLISLTIAQDEFLKDNAIKSLSHLCNLKELELHSLQIKGTEFSSLPPSLTILDCEGSHNIGDSSIQWLNRLTSLQQLNLSGTKVTGTSFSSLAASLTTLDLTECINLLDSSMKGLSHLSNLENLCLTNTQIEGIEFTSLPPSLVTLSCSRCNKLKEEAIIGLNHCTALSELNLGSSSIKGTYFSHLPVSLYKLDCGCSDINDEAIKGLNHCNNLEHLDLASTNIVGVYFDSLPEALEFLDLMYCKKMIDPSIAGLTHCKKLKKLILSKTQLQGLNFATLPKSIEKLWLRACVNLLDVAMENLTHCQNLKKLDVAGTNIFGTAFNLLSPSLLELNCSGCKKLQGGAIEGLANRKKLKIINFPDFDLYAWDWERH